MLELEVNVSAQVACSQAASKTLSYDVRQRGSALRIDGQVKHYFYYYFHFSPHFWSLKLILAPLKFGFAYILVCINFGEFFKIAKISTHQI